MGTSADGYLAATAGEDKALKIFDVINFGKGIKKLTINRSIASYYIVLYCRYD